MSKPDKCRRCGDCRSMSHHWMPNSDFGDGDDPRNPASVEFAYLCKHCPALGGECPDCMGDGEAVQIVSIALPGGGDYPEEADATCLRCKGEGVIPGLRFDVFEKETAHV